MSMNTKTTATDHEYHEKAVEHHKHAAKHHEEAAKHLKNKDASKGAHHAHLAHAHGMHAQDHAIEASKAFADEHGEKSHGDHSKK
jgi:hypothetical protein